MSWGGGVECNPELNEAQTAGGVRQTTGTGSVTGLHSRLFLETFGLRKTVVTIGTHVLIKR
jgi:hypothetical protein